MFDRLANDSAVMFLLGMAALLALAAPLLLRYLRRFAELKDDNARLAMEAERQREILAAAPDGLFLWDHARNEEKCSRRLAVLLGLEAGTQAQFCHVLSRFSDNEAKKLAAAVGSLRRDGTSFDLLLDLNGRRLQATGSRAATLDGRVLNDLMWVRDVSETFSPQDRGAAAPGQNRASGGNAFEHFTLMLDALPLAVWIRDSGLNVVFANRAAKRLGMVEGEAGGGTAKLAEEALSEKAPASEQRLLEGRRGAFLVTCTEVPVRGWSGTVGFAVEQTPGQYDVAANKGRVVALDGHIEGRVLDLLGVAIATFDSETRLTFANSAFWKLWGLPPERFDAAPTMVEILDYLRAHRSLPEVADFSAFKEQQLALFTGLSGRQDTLLHLPDGRTIRRLVTPYSAGGLFFCFEDDTDRLALERSFKALDAVQRETLDHLYEGIAVFGGDGRLKLSNPVFAGIWNLAPERLNESLHISDFIDATRPLVAGPGGIGDNDWGGHVKKVVARFAERRTVTGRMALSNGMIVDYSNVALPDGATLLIYLDVSDSARVEAALRQRAEALDQANRLKSEFIANVSHEVTTPLATLIGYADILAQENYGQLNARQKEYGQGILENAQNLMDVINDILDLAAIEAGMMTLQLDTVELHTMMASLVHLIRERARRKSLKVNFDCPPDIGWIVADEKRLRQVLFNLLSNAINFTPPRGAITLSAERCGDGGGEGEGETIVFKVADTGRGIPKGRQLDIFEAFANAEQENTAGDENGRPGAGLGLTLVKRFVELHGGTVDIKSPPGRGVTVTCTLPASGRKQAAPVAVQRQDIA